MNFQELSRKLHRDEARKHRLYTRSARLVNVFALDAVEEMTAEDLARRVLEKLGIKHDTDDPVSALESYLEGHDAGDRARRGVREHGGMDSASGSFLDRYLSGTP
jgi:hypothetical protein